MILEGKRQRRATVGVYGLSVSLICKKMLSNEMGDGEELVVLAELLNEC